MQGRGTGFKSKRGGGKAGWKVSHGGHGTQRSTIRFPLAQVDIRALTIDNDTMTMTMTAATTIRTKEEEATMPNGKTAAGGGRGG